MRSLVAPSAQDGLSQMLAFLGEPTGCKIWSTSATEPYSVVGVHLVFADGSSLHPDFALTVVLEQDDVVVTAIASGAPADPAFPDCVPETDPRLAYLSPVYSYLTAGAVALGSVTEELPLRRSEDQSVVYKGYALEVEQAYGPSAVPARITIYALESGTVELGGVTQEVQEELPLDAKPGDRLLVPLMKVAYYDTRDLEADEYWVQANWSTFFVNDDGICIRATGQELDAGGAHEFPLSELEGIIVEQRQGTKLHRVSADGRMPCLSPWPPAGTTSMGRQASTGRSVR